MKPSLLAYLRSPLDGSEFRLDARDERDGEILAGALSDASGNTFPIIDGLPLFAEDLSDDETFGFKWRLIGDTYGREGATREFRQQWYLDRFGFATRERLLAFVREHGMVLDAGTGSGVDAEVFAEAGVPVVAVDLSKDAAGATYRRLGHLPNLHVLQADLTRLPFASNAFDFVSCDQVLHHTPDTHASFGALVRHLCPGGHLALYVYSKKAPIREFADDLIRDHVRGMSADECYEFCRGITLLGKALAEIEATVDVPEAIPVLGVEAGPQDVQRLIYWIVLKCFWNPDYDFTTNNIVNFDWYHPRYAYRHTPDEVRSWHAEHGLDIERLEVVPSGIASVARRRG